MAWGDGKPEGNGGNSCPQASHPPTPLALGRSTSPCRRASPEGPSSLGGLIAPVGRKIECPTPAPLSVGARVVDRCECSSGGVRRLEATAFFRCLEASYPSGRALPQTGQNLL